MYKNNKNWLPWLVLALLGLFLIFGHNAALQIICKIIGVGLILLAVPGIIDWWKEKSQAPEAIASLLTNAVFCLLGLWILFSTQSFINLINIVLGLIIIVISLAMLYSAWKLHHTSAIVMSAIGIVIGIIVACCNAATTLFAVAAGAGLIYTAITGYLSQKAMEA